MSELFAARVVAVSSDTATLFVRSVHPDSGPVAPTSTFALMLIFDPIINSGYSAFRQYKHLEASPLAQVMDLASYLDPRWVRANARAFVAKATVRKGMLELKSTHPAWIAHLRKGMSWDTAAYNLGAGEAAAPRIPAPADAPVTHSTDPAAGFRVGAPKSERSAVKRAFIPLYGSNRYVADPRITDAAAMKKAAKSMLGEPVLLQPKRGPAQVGAIIEVRKDGVVVYRESEGGWGSSSEGFASLAAFGRAWLKEDAGPATGEKSATKSAKKTVKKAAKKAAKKSAKKTGKKTPAKKSAKKTAEKAVAKKSVKKSAKKSVKKAAKKSSVTKVAKKTPAKKAAKKTPAKKAAKKTGKKTPAKKVAKKTPAKKAAKKAAKKTPAKKAAKKSPAKKALAKKAPNTAAKKALAKKAPAKKAAK